MIAHGIDLDSEAIREFCHRWKVRELCVFGSILRDDFRSESDVDFLVDYDEDCEWDLSDLMDMRDELAGFVGRRVDLLTRAGVEGSSNRFLKREIFSTLERLYAA
jgi:predicted nucleotidyltransferase